MKSRVALAVAIVLAILAAIGIKIQMTKKTQEQIMSQQSVNVAVAVKRIDKDREITSDMFTIKPMPFVAGMYTDSEAFRITGQRASTTIEPGTAILASQLRPRTIDRLDPAKDLLRGYRLTTIPVDKVSGLAGQLTPGCVVDILVTTRQRGGENAPVASETRTLLTGVYVYSVDLHADREQMTDQDRRDYASYSTVTLRVLPLQAQLLENQAKEGSLHLVLRNPGDTTGHDPTELGVINSTNLDSVIKKAINEQPPSSTPGPPEKRD